MKLWSSEHVFHHPWDVVSQAVWRKYPTELNPSVKAIDVLERRVSALLYQSLSVSVDGLSEFSAAPCFI